MDSDEVEMIEGPINPLSVVQIGCLLEEMMETSETDEEKVTWANHLKTFEALVALSELALSLDLELNLKED